MNKRCQLIVEMEMDGKTSVQIDGKTKDVLAATAMPVDDVCEAAKIPPAAFAMVIPMFASLKRRFNNDTISFKLTDTLYILGDVIDRGPDGIKI